MGNLRFVSSPLGGHLSAPTHTQVLRLTQGVSFPWVGTSHIFSEVLACTISVVLKL